MDKEYFNDNWINTINYLKTNLFKNSNIFIIYQKNIWFELTEKGELLLKFGHYQKNNKEIAYHNFFIDEKMEFETKFYLSRYLQYTEGHLRNKTSLKWLKTEIENTYLKKGLVEKKITGINRYVNYDNVFVGNKKK